MGAWGYGTFDNDSALDFVSYFVNGKALVKLVKQKHKDQDPNELRAAAAIVLALHKINDLWFDQEVIDKLIESLEYVINDKEWFDSWSEARDAKDIKRQFYKFVKQLKELEGY